MGKIDKSPEALKKTHTSYSGHFWHFLPMEVIFLEQEKIGRQIGEAVVYVDGSVCGKWICTHIRRFFRIPNTFRIPGALETNNGYFYFPL